jgi:hypothetical protein
LYNPTVLAILSASQRNELFLNQTEHEFAISIAFYKKLINSNHLISFTNNDNATFLLNIALIYGKYPGMQIRSIYKAIDFLKLSANEENLIQFFEYIFIKYENPKILTQHINNLNLSEIDILMHVIQGNNIRNHPDIPIPISRKESFILLNSIPLTVHFKDNVLKRLIIASMLIIKSSNTYLLNIFFFYCKTFEHKLDFFYKDIDFWSEIYCFLSKVKWDETDFAIERFIDYFEYVKYNEYENYSIKGRTVNSVINSICDWYSKANYLRCKELIGLSWEGIGIPDSVIDFEGQKYVFKEIKDGQSLFTESIEMKHCAYTYIESCANNYCSLFSMKKIDNSISQNNITIEVIDNFIIQVSRKNNEEPEQNDLKIIEKWCDLNNLISLPI